MIEHGDVLRVNIIDVNMIDVNMIDSFWVNMIETSLQMASLDSLAICGRVAEISDLLRGSKTAAEPAEPAVPRRIDVVRWVQENLGGLMESPKPKPSAG